MAWRLTLRMRVRDKAGDLWTTAGDTPFPLNGYNFVRVRKARIGWWVDFGDRWTPRSPGAFNVECIR